MLHKIIVLAGLVLSSLFSSCAVNPVNDDTSTINSDVKKLLPGAYLNPDSTYSSELSVTVPAALVSNGKIKIKFKYVGGNFNCYGLGLTSLEGCPETVGGWFDCYDNKLTNLKGAPNYVGSHFSCAYNQLISLEGAPETVEGDFYCLYSAVKFSEYDVMSVSSVKGKVVN